jgi:hypothetical protein
MDALVVVLVAVLVEVHRLDHALDGRQGVLRVQDLKAERDRVHAAF